MKLVTVGLFFLLVGGVWQLSSVLFSNVDRRVDRSDVRALSASNAGAVAVETVVVTAGLRTVTAVLSHGRLSLSFKLVAAASLLVGGALVARGLYVRLRFPETLAAI